MTDDPNSDAPRAVELDFPQLAILHDLCRNFETDTPHLAKEIRWIFNEVESLRREVQEDADLLDAYSNTIASFAVQLDALRSRQDDV